MNSNTPYIGEHYMYIQKSVNAPISGEGMCNC